MNKITIPYEWMHDLVGSSESNWEYHFWFKAMAMGFPVRGNFLLEPDMHRIKRWVLEKNECDLCWELYWEDLKDE